MSKPNLLWGRVAIKETLFEAVETVARAYDFKTHPYFVWARDEATTREAFRAGQVPFRFAVEAFSQSLAAVLARMPRVEDRIHVAQNVAEEHGHGNLSGSHKYTFLEYLRALGATEEALADPCPIWVTAFNHALRNLCLAQSHEIGAAALGMIEHLYVGVSHQIGTLITDRAWVDPKSQSHYAVHSQLDVSHARELLEVAATAGQPTELALLARVRDIGTSLAITEAGVEVIGAHQIEVSSAGKFRGIRIPVRDRDREGDTFPEEALAQGERIGERLHAIGFRGACGIDAWCAKTRGGGLHKEFLGEINARLTFGWLAHAWRSRLSEIGAISADGPLDLRTSSETGPPRAGISLVTPGDHDTLCAWIDPRGRDSAPPLL